MSRTSSTLAIAAAVAVVLVGSFALARVFSAAARERAAATDVLRAQAAGDTATTVRLLVGCRRRRACTARVRGQVASLRRPGRFEVVRIDPATRLSPRAGAVVMRVVWRAGDSVPVVQCVRTRRTGSLLAGFAVAVVAVSPRMPSDTSC